MFMPEEHDELMDVNVAPEGESQDDESSDSYTEEDDD